MIIADKIEVEDVILASGGFSDVRRGKYRGHIVAVRTLRVTVLQGNVLNLRKVNANDIFSVTVLTAPLQQFCQEVVLWNTLSHPNVLKLAGVQGDMKIGQFITVSEWMKHGNIMDYIKDNHVNRLGLVRFFFASLAALSMINRSIVARGSRGSGIPPWCQPNTRGPQRSRYPRLLRPIPFLTFNRQTSSCQTTLLLVLASRILVSCQ